VYPFFQNFLDFAQTQKLKHFWKTGDTATCPTWKSLAGISPRTKTGENWIAPETGLMRCGKGGAPPKATPLRSDIGSRHEKTVKITIGRLLETEQQDGFREIQRRGDLYWVRLEPNYPTRSGLTFARLVELLHQ